MSTDNRQPDIDLTEDTAALEHARDRRVALGEAADLLEDLLARPGSDPQWTLRVADGMQGLGHAFRAHVTEVQAEDGLLPQLHRDAARLSGAINLIQIEHVGIGAEIAAVSRLITECGGDCSIEVVETIREAATDVLRSISRHRQKGADLVYEAYTVDIGGG